MYALDYLCVECDYQEIKLQDAQCTLIQRNAFWLKGGKSVEIKILS